MRIFKPVILIFAVLSGCGRPEPTSLVEDNFRFAQRQLRYALDEIERANERLTEQLRLREPVSPRTVDPDGSLHLVPSHDWTSGFFPGELWYMYEYTGDTFWLDRARVFTAHIEREKRNAGTHDMGFKIGCSFGNGYRLTGDPHYREVLLESAATLATRYSESVGAIRSWDHNRKKWNYPVIIDNMMNLELLFLASRESGDRSYHDIAVEHARTTMKNHFRDDYSTFHVVDYDPETGLAVNRHTHQGYDHGSTWSRGQAWALYGYTMCYRETRLPEFVEQAERVAGFIFGHPNLPPDMIPYWDFNAPGIPDEPRDVSAAAIVASALYELADYVPEQGAVAYRDRASAILENITRLYRAQSGTQNGFILIGSTGSAAHDSEVDVPLVYADYYFLEALLRKDKADKKAK